MNKLEHLPWRICNNSVHIIELMFVEEPYAGSIFIDSDEILAVCAKEENFDEPMYVKSFPMETNVKEIETWIKKKLELI